MTSHSEHNSPSASPRPSPALPSTIRVPAVTPRLMSAMCSAIDIIGRSPRCYSSPNLGQLSSGASPSSRLTASIESTQSGSSTEVVRNITELPEFSTSAVLHFCKRKILIPYQRYLSLLGWRSPIAPDEACICSWILLRIHVLVVVAFMLLGYLLQYAACFRRDIVDGYKVVTADNTNGGGKRLMLMSNTVMCKGSSLGLYFVPDFLHFSAYAYTYYLLRWCETEELQILLERVFLQAFYSRSHFLTQPKLVRTLRVFLAVSFFWILLSTIISILHVLAEFPYFTWMQPPQKNVEVLLITLLVLSTTWNDLILVTIIMSYAIQCQLLNSFVRGLCERVREKSMSLQEAIKEINESSKIMKHLNEDFANSVSLMILYTGVLATSGVLWLYGSGRHLDTRYPLKMITNVLSTFMWGLIFVFPLVQAAKLSAACHCIKKLGLYLLQRPFGYQDTPQAQLDTFLLFTSSVDMQATLFRVPVKPAMLFGILALIVFIVLVLSQLDILSIMTVY